MNSVEFGLTIEIQINSGIKKCKQMEIYPVPAERELPNICFKKKSVTIKVLDFLQFYRNVQILGFHKDFYPVEQFLGS